LESIGAVEKSKSRKDIYQEIVSMPVEPDFDNDAVMQDDEVCRRPTSHFSPLFERYLNHFNPHFRA
jgi:hypothetical protein